MCNTDFKHLRTLNYNIIFGSKTISSFYLFKSYHLETVETHLILYANTNYNNKNICLQHIQKVYIGLETHNSDEKIRKDVIQVIYLGIECYGLLRPLNTMISDK